MFAVAVCCLLFDVCRALRGVRCLAFVVCLQMVDWSFQIVACSLYFVLLEVGIAVCCWLCANRCVLCVGCRSCFVVCCLLFVVCCLLLVVCCSLLFVVCCSLIVLC